jgi:hypothetical protein
MAHARHANRQGESKAVSSIAFVMAASPRNLAAMISVDDRLSMSVRI